MRVDVDHNIGDLARDCAAIPVQMHKDGRKVVRANVLAGNKAARRIARAAGGPHGKAYFKRIGAEMTGPLVGEYGPEGIPKTEFVGAGYRNGPPNRDLEKSLDLIRPAFRKQIGEMVDGLFWPGGDQ